MSHNLINVNDNEPNRQAEVSTALTDLITINSPTDGQYLAKAATDWGTASVSEVAAETVSSINGYSYYGVGVYPYDAVDNYIFYSSKNNYNTPSFVFRIAASGSYVPVANNSWFQAIQIYQSGGSPFVGNTFLLEASISPATTTATRIEYQWVLGDGFVPTNSYTVIGPPVVIEGQGQADTAYGRFVYESSMSSSVYVSLKIRYLSGSADLSGDYLHNGENMIIRTIA